MTDPKSFLFTAWEGGGNITPLIEAVRRLVARGHGVRFMGDTCNSPDALAAGATFVPWNRAPNRADRTPETQDCRDWAAVTPQDGLIHVIADIWCGPALRYAEDVIDELHRQPADLVVCSEMLFGVMAACESIGQPLAILAANISLAPIPGIPPVGPGLPPARTDGERTLHAQIAAGTEQLFDSGLPALNAARTQLGLKPLNHLLEQFQAASVELLATSSAFDFPATDLPDRVRYVGPLLGDPQWAKPWTTPWPETDTRPLVAVSFSTTFQNHARVLQNVIDALAPLSVRVLVTLGGSIKASELHAAENCMIVASAPHSVVMREAALVVTHGGHGTVMQALVGRAPMLVIPHGRDQNDNAVRVTHRGAGLSLMPDAPVDAIRVTCERLLNEASFRAAAKRLGDRVAADAAAPTVVQELETLAKRKRSGATQSRGSTLLERARVVMTAALTLV